MSGKENWKDLSNWRTRDPAASTAKSSPQSRNPRQNLLGASSWRTRDVTSNAGPQSPQQEPRNSWTPKSRPFDRERTIDKRQVDEESAAKAIAEGRRIYIGNLNYQAKPDNIEDLLKTNDLKSFEAIHISIDPFTGRNPSYCFVEFSDRESADLAMSTLNGKLLLGREVKCRPCIPKGGASGGRQGEGSRRWGNWKGENTTTDEGGEASLGQDIQQGEKEGLPSSFSRYDKDFSKQRLYVGGLPRMHDQAMNSAEIRELFKEFQVEAISKRVTAHESVRAKPGHHDFCFVDFATPEQAQAAIDAINGTSFCGGRLKVSFASARSRKWQERESIDVKG
ncbi:RNA-binding domain-containing protein [Daldinia vernicosa]|uniref:RNA-binding domain-containing protein n=1 Tax=Daldinia vernicosa TaxID=114800 RepID=UPI002008BCD6|nr:RNA-binding domain-containing protein [Daldinia vernicosa]KAI0853925.1 RNA-binding domain-containing protein [Daldinia vernicosa]